MHHRPTEPCGLARRPSQGEPDIYEDWQGLRCLSPRKIKALIDDLQMQLSIAGMETAAYQKGQDDGTQGVVGRWQEALEQPTPAPGVMNEPLESLYRRTEALRDEIRFLKAEKMRLEREVSELKRKLYGNHAQE